MARTAPVPNLPPIPGMCPSIAVLAGGGDGGGGSGNGAGDGGGGDPNGGDGSGDNAAGDGTGTGACGLGEGGGCPNHHGGSGSGTSAQGDPVDFATGRVFTAPIEDVAYEGAWPVRFWRMYASGPLDLGFGKGFTHAFGWSIVEGRTALTVHTPEGTTVELPLVKPGEALLGPHGWLVHREGAGFRIDLVGGQTLQLEPEKMEGGHVLTAVIDNRRNTTVLEYAGGLLESITDPVGRKLRFVRDGGHVAKVLAIDPRATDPTSAAMIEVANFIYDERGRMVCGRDAEGFATRYDYDDLDRLVRLVKPGGTAFHYRYDDAGRCVETWGEHEHGTPDPSLDASVPELLRDERTKARGIHHVALEFGPDGFRDAVDASNTHRGIANEHGKFDQLVSGGRAYRRTYDAQGFLATFTDAAGSTMRYLRDERGRELLIEDADGGTTRIERYPNGDVRRITDAAGGTTEVFQTPSGFAFRDPIDALYQIALDDRGRMTETIGPDGSRTRIEYDAFANVSRRTMTTRGAVTSFQYDAWGRCTGLQAPDGAVTRLTWSLRGKVLSFDAPGDSFRFTHDANNDLTSVTGPRGTTTLEYGLNGRVHRVQPPIGSAFEFFYDREGRPVRLRHAGAEHLYERRSDGLVSVERTADGRTLHYRYDESGRLTEQRCGTIRTALERDRRGRVIKRIHGDGVEESFSYDVVGNLVAATRDGTKVTFERNALGWILGESQTIGEDTIDVRTDYDAVGKLRRLETSIGHVFDVDRRAPGELHMELDGERVLSTEDVLGREIQRRLSGGGVVASRYDGLGRLVQQSSAMPDTRPSEAPAWVGAKPQHVAIESLFHFSGGELASSSSTQTGSVQLDYDPLGRLLRALPSNAAAEILRYDERGQPYEAGKQRAFESGRVVRDGSRTFTYDEANRLVATVDTNDQGEATTTRHAWLGGRLTKTELPDGRVVEYVYDAFGRRLQKRVVHRRKVTSETRFVWESTRILHELTTGAGAVTGKTYCFGARGDVPWAERKLIGEGDLKSPTWRPVGNWSFYLVDPTGAPHATVDSTGALETSWRRSVWGKVEGAAPTALRVLGQYADDETGLHYNWHRYYDPATGRYISPDPLGVVDGLDPFSYAGNCPTSLVDPTGLMFTIIRDKSGAIIHRGENLGAGGGTTDINPALKGARGSCSETGALNSLANSLKGTPEENRAEIARRFNEGEITMETFEGNREDFEKSSARQNDARRQNPCPQCSQLLQDMKITEGVVGVNPGTGKSGKWRPTWKMIPGRGRK